MGNRRWRLWAAAGLAGAGLLTAGALQAQSTVPPVPPGAPAYLSNFPNFAPSPTSAMPGDINIPFQQALEKAQLFPLVQREFDLYSWQMFFAVNWPTSATGAPAPTLTATGNGLAPHWANWQTVPQIYRTDGQRPDACPKLQVPKPMVLPGAKKPAAAKPLPLLAVSKGLTPFSEQKTADPRTTRFLGVISAVGDLNVNTLGDIQQAFTGPLIDQNGEFVYYEILMDPNEVGYLCSNALYNINGQVAFSNAGQKVVMPWGDEPQQWSGSFEIKIAWKVLKKGVDDFSRFYTQPAFIKDEDSKGNEITRAVTVGMVGMHIGHKSTSSPQWIWSTFEQVDNLDVDPVAHPNLNPNFTDPNCPICTVNVQPQAVNGVYPKIPVQAWRAIPIPGDKIALNAQVQAAMAAMGSVWQYYQLIDTQWPTNPGTIQNPNAPTPWNAGLAGSVTNKPGGSPTPVFLTNITMETYFQGGNQVACNAQETPNNFTCPPAGNPAPPIWTSPQNNSSTPGLPGTGTQIFGTESCMGCHSSAGIYTSYNPTTQQGTQSGQLTGDFSWLMSQKASWNPNVPTPPAPPAGKPKPVGSPKPAKAG
ncbi:hypothetical protein QO010_000394 [Caulobacter ginsengisoli]|uniref:Cytochrome c domain-containing protein n=1 Tax=Caulobacter ginsengisoli TaxID=400775 RepID=A0ABU0IMN4_9CAUL|nr:hypothetical protein [Caulobacter ginsengisoli]MDQ0462646.1 hypothetical protein [Caulobacter ginsengisoli]